MILPLEFTLADRTLHVAFDIDEGNVPDASLMYYLKHQQVPEPEVCQVLVRVLREGDTAIDAGANVGFFTIIMSKLVGDTGRVVAVEPGANNFEKLHRNIVLNKCQNVTVVREPLWCSPVDVPMYLYDDGGANSLWPNEGDVSSGMLRATTLDAICDGRTPKLIKMDIEGSEFDAIQGGRKMFATQRPVLVTEMNPAALKRAGSSPFKLRRALEAFGYRSFVLHPDGALPSQVPTNARIEPKRQNSNVLFSTSLDVGKAWPEVAV